MSESLRNDGRVWVPKKKGDNRAPERNPRGRARLLPRAPIPEFRQSGAARRRFASAKEVCDEGRGVGPGGQGVYLDFADAIRRLGERRSAKDTATSSTCMRRSPGRTPTKSRCGSIPAPHYTMGGLWVDYQSDVDDSGAFRGRRGQLLRPRRQPSGRERADARSGRWLFHSAVHAAELHRVQPARKRWTHRTRRSRPPRTRSTSASRSCSISTASAPSIHSTRNSAGSMWENCGMARSEAGLKRILPRSRRCARSSGTTSISSGRARN